MDVATIFYALFAFVVGVIVTQVVRGMWAGSESPPSPLEQLFQAFQAVTAQSTSESSNHSGVVGGLLILVLIIAFGM